MEWIRKSVFGGNGTAQGSILDAFAKCRPSPRMVFSEGVSDLRESGRNELFAFEAGI